jgi:hypothetical protein
MADSGIPNLPKHEVPEVGYKLIRDALIDNFGALIDTERTASDQVIELLQELAERRRREPCPRSGSS